MEELILKITEQLLAVSIGFVGLIFTSLKKSKQFKDFVNINSIK